ncbi:COX2 oxidase, partial [Aegithalos caudatus]|nr:COX2 oxidase [Aegithalos caudatus]
MANHSQFCFQEASSPIIEELIEFHSLMVTPAICSLVLYLLAFVLIENLSS